MKGKQYGKVGNSESSFFTSPVPIKQLPINEYRRLKQGRFFRWATLKRCKYIAKILAVGVCGMLVSVLVAAVRLSLNYSLFSSFFWGVMLGKIAILLCLIQLYVTWHYIYKRLMSRKVAYEIPQLNQPAAWLKPKSVLMRDRLVARFEVRPILKRIQTTIGLILMLLGGGLLILFLIANT